MLEHQIYRTVSFKEIFMAHTERMQTECPPDAHKVIRPPESEVKATICVSVHSEEAELYGIEDFCEVLALMGDKPLIYTEDAALKDKINCQKAASEIEPSYLKKDGDVAYLTYSDGAQGQALPFIDYTADPDLAKNFFEDLGKKQFIIIDSASMLILRSISTVFPWDRLLAGDFLRQYLKANADVSADDLQLLTQIRYGRKDGFSIKQTHPEAYAYLRLERKLFLQYPAEDD